MMKCCCLIVFLFCTIDVSNGGILSGTCHSSNGTCGKRDVPCKETFGSEWTYIGKCCNKRPCCKFLKAPCVPETCPTGFKLLSNQASSANCYSYHGLDSQLPLPLARDNCATTAGAYLWRPNTEQEANAVNNEFNIPSDQFIWTGGREVNLGTFVFDIDNSGFSIDDQPFGVTESLSVERMYAIGMYAIAVQKCT
ncbi:uncharacterized protein [Mytilus edulis]|uniref:uncharacterized protein n=1 Tax=Mytilus edulis TaxID=6550 RepID=UPI0039F12013